MGLGRPRNLYATYKMGRKVSSVSGLISTRDLTLPQHWEGNSFQCLGKHRMHSALFTVRRLAILTGFLKDSAEDAGFRLSDWSAQGLSDGVIILRVKRASMGVKVQGVNRHLHPCEFCRRLDSILKQVFKSPNGLCVMFLECRKANFEV